MGARPGQPSTASIHVVGGGTDGRLQRVKRSKSRCTGKWGVVRHGGCGSTAARGARAAMAPLRGGAESCARPGWSTHSSVAGSARIVAPPPRHLIQLLLANTGMNSIANCKRGSPDVETTTRASSRIRSSWRRRRAGGRAGLGCQRGGEKGEEKEGNLGVYSPMAERAGFGRNPAGGGRLRSCSVIWPEYGHRWQRVARRSW